MSRVGKNPIKIESSINVTINKGGDFNHLEVIVKGPKGELKQSVRKGINVEVKEQEVIVTRDNDSKINRSLHGLYRSLIQNMVNGVKDGFKKELELVGVGYKVKVNGQALEFALGLNHPVIVPIPEGLTAEAKDNTDIIITGIDKERVGQFAAEVREMKKPEPYKGKGIRYKGEYVRRKAGKAAISSSK